MALPQWFPFRRKPSLNVPIDHVLRKDSQLHGRLVFSGGLSVEGVVEGELQPQGPNSAIVVGKGARVVTSELKADILLIHGQVQAQQIQAKQVVLTATAKVIGSIDADAVEIHQGARFEGQVVTRGVVPATVPAPTPETSPRSSSAAVAKERLEGLTGRKPAVVAEVG